MSIRQRATVRPVARPPDSDADSVAEVLTGPVSEVARNRKCTDLFCFVGFCFFALCLLVLSCYSWANGFPGRMTRGSDLYGNACGFGDLEDWSYTYFLDPVTDPKASICLSGCPVDFSTESLCVYDQSQAPITDFGCFNSYVSKPFFNHYCLPADHIRRSAAISYLYDSERATSRVLGDLARVTVTQAWDILAVAGLIAGAVCAVHIVGLRFASKN